ncbi:MAG: GNAT family N-acetyltransferase, partial [Actinomycetota bacterium]
MSDSGELHGTKVVLAPLAAEHLPELHRIRLLPEVVARWGVEELTEGWPAEAEPESTFLAVLAGGAVVGMIQYSEETEPMYRHASIDIFLDPAVHSQGLGRDAVGTMARHLIEDRGHHRITIDPAADNLPAIRAYAAVGFRPVG